MDRLTSAALRQAIHSRPPDPDRTVNFPILSADPLSRLPRSGLIQPSIAGPRNYRRATGTLVRALPQSTSC